MSRTLAEPMTLLEDEQISVRGSILDFGERDADPVAAVPLDGGW